MKLALQCFCDECGAVVGQQATLCSYCGRPPRASFTQSVAQVTAGQMLPGSPATGPLAQGQLFALRYRVVQKVGEGGFGTIYKAEDLDNHRRLVAIKQINLDTLTPREMIEATDAYNREVRHLSRLRHGSLPHFYDTFTDPGHWYIIMDFIEGKTLEERLKQTWRHRLSPQQVLAIGLKLCDVLGYLHAQRPSIIFRDVKPENIMLTKKGHVYLIDFGIARHYAPDRKRDTGSLGTPGYAAPEQYGKAQTTAQTDVFGLGATLQTLLIGKDPLTLAMRKRRWWHRFQGRSRRRFQQLFDVMLEPDACARPQSMEEVRQRLLALKRKPLIGSRTKRVLSCLRRAFADAFLLLLVLSVVLSFFFDIDSSPFPMLFLVLYAILYVVVFPLRLYVEREQ